MCRRLWPLASGCWPPGAPTRTIPTMRPRWRWLPFGPRICAASNSQPCEVLRLLAKRNVDLGSHRTRVVCRLHALFAELAPGGIAKEMYVSDAQRLMAKITPQTPAEQVRYDVALELLERAQTRRPDQRVAPPDPPRRQGVGHVADRALRGGPDHRRTAHRLRRRRPPLCQQGRVRVLQRHAPIEWSSGGRVVRRLSQRGNRQLNHAIYMAAICQIRQTGSQARPSSSARSRKARQRRRRSAPSSAR